LSSPTKRKMYPTDVTDAQWQIIKNTLDPETRKRKHPLRSIWNAIMYVIKTGIQWRMLPSNFAKWQLVYYYFRKWVNEELFDALLDKLRARLRVRMGQQGKASLGIMDSQSVRWGNNRSLNGFDGNKKIKGIKRHVLVDKNGFLLAVMVTVAHFHDSKVVMQLMRVLKDAYCNIKLILADGGYRGDVVEEVKRKFGYAIKIVMRTDKTNTFTPIHKRWVIERTFSWFDNDRRLCRNYELLMETAEEVVKLSAIKLLLNKF